MPFTTERMLTLERLNVLRRMEELNRELLHLPVMPLPLFSDSSDEDSEDELLRQLERELGLPHEHFVIHTYANLHAATINME
jgi:hypothetical protein